MASNPLAAWAVADRYPLDYWPANSGSTCKIGVRAYDEVAGSVDSVTFRWYVRSGTTGSITGISSASPTVITSASHGLTTGDYIIIDQSNVGQSGKIGCDVVAPVTVVTTDTFSIPVDMSDVTTGTGGTWEKLTAHSVTAEGTTASSHTVTSPEYVDVSGYGVSGSYWAVDLNKSDLDVTGDDADDLIVAFDVTSDSTTNDMSARRSIGGRSLRLGQTFLSTQYVDPTNGSDANAGTSRALAVATLDQAVDNLVGTGGLIYLCDNAGAAHTLTIAGTVDAGALHGTSSTTRKFMEVRPDPTNTETVTVDFTTRRVIRHYISFAGCTMTCAGDIALEEASVRGGHNLFRGNDITLTGRTSSIITEGAGHFTAVGNDFHGFGDQCIILTQDSSSSGHDASRVWVSANTAGSNTDDRPSTCIRNQASGVLIEGWTVQRAGTDGSYDYDQHFEFSQISGSTWDTRDDILYVDNLIYNNGFDSGGVAASNGAGFTDATNTVTASGAFTNASDGDRFYFKLDSDGATDPGTLVTIVSVIDNDRATVSPKPAVGDVTVGQASIHVHNYSFSVINGNCRNMGFFGNRYANVQNTQQVLQFEEGSSGTPTLVENLQMAHNTFIATDSEGLRGVYFSATGSASDDYPGPITMRNNILDRIAQDGTGSGANPITNIVGTYDEDYNVVRAVDGSLSVGTNTSTLTTAQLGLSNVDTGDFTPDAGSSLSGAGEASSVVHSPTGVVYDDTTPDLGAGTLAEVPVQTNNLLRVRTNSARYRNYFRR